MAIEEALQGDTDFPGPCALPLCGECGGCGAECSCQGGIEATCEPKPIRSPLQFSGPVGQCAPPEGTGYKFHEIIAHGLVWPAVGYDVTVEVEVPSRYAIGQGVYVCGGYGWLKVTAVRESSQSISLRNMGHRANVAPGVQTTTPVAIAPGILPNVDVTYDDLKEEIEDAVEDEVTKQVDAKIDKAPKFPTTTVNRVSNGRIPLWIRKTGSEEESTLGEQNVPVKSASGFLATLRNEGSAQEDMRFDLLDPASANYGDLLAVSPTNYCGNDPPAPRKVDPEEVVEDSVAASSFGLFGWREETVSCESGNKVRRVFQRLKKLLFHSANFTTPVTDDNTLRILVANQVGDTFKVAPLTLGENQVLAGDGNGGVKIQSALDLVPPSIVAVPGAYEILYNGSDGNGNLIPNNFFEAPDCVTHAILELHLETGNNAVSTMQLNGADRLVAGPRSTSDPATADLVIWLPLSGPNDSFTYNVSHVGDNPTASATIKLIGYQCNRSA